MRTWLGFIVAPSAALTLLSLDYALVPHACRLRTGLPLYAANGATLAFCVLCAIFNARAWHRRRPGRRATSAASRAQPVFLAFVAACVAGLSALAVLALSIPTWVLSPCR